MFGLLAGGTLLHELIRVALEAAPLEVLAHPLVRGTGARVAADRAVVKRGDELGLERGVGADPQAAVLTYYSILQCPALIVLAHNCQLGDQLL